MKPAIEALVTIGYAIVCAFVFIVVGCAIAFGLNYLVGMIPMMIIMTLATVYYITYQRIKDRQEKEKEENP